MDVIVTYPLKRPIILDDHWPMSGHGVMVAFQETDNLITAVSVTLVNEPIETAPKVKKASAPGGVHELAYGARAEMRAREIVGRFVDYVNLHFAFEVDFDAGSLEFRPANEVERAQIDLLKIDFHNDRRTSRLPFNMIAQAFFASESDTDASFVSRMLSFARDALLSNRYIESFRYSFLLIEANYGRGKSRTADLIPTLAGSVELNEMIAAMREHFQEPGTPNSEAVLEVLEKYETTEGLVRHLVGQRGFYFHGNLNRPNHWHPDRQEEALALGEICFDLAQKIAQATAAAMFEPSINDQFLENAKTHGVIMQIDVEFLYITGEGHKRRGTTTIDMPGTKLTSNLAVTVGRHFNYWAQTELQGERLVQAKATERDSGEPVFLTQYLGGEPV